MTDEKFEARMKDLERNLSLFPSKREMDEDVFWSEDLRKRSLEAAESEPQIWDDPYRDRLYFTGTDPGMTVDNAFEKLDMLLEDWANGRITPVQRARCVAMEYKVESQMLKMGYENEQGPSSEAWKVSAENLVKFESRVGIDILRFI